MINMGHSCAKKVCISHESNLQIIPVTGSPHPMPGGEIFGEAIFGPTEPEVVHRDFASVVEEQSEHGWSVAAIASPVDGGGWIRNKYAWILYKNPCSPVDSMWRLSWNRNQRSRRNKRSNLNRGAEKK